MTKTVEDAFVHQDFIGQYKIGDCLGVSGHCCSASPGHELSYAKATKCLWYLNGVLADDRPVFKRCPAAAIVRLTRRRSALTLRLASRGFSALRSGHDPDRPRSQEFEWLHASGWRSLAAASRDLRPPV